MPDEQFQQDLEPAGAETVEVDRVTSNEEEATHRIGHGAQAARKQHASRRRGRPRRHRARPPEAPGVALLAVAARDHNVEVARLRLFEERGDKLRRMLKVRIHHADPWSPRHAETLHHRRSQAANVTTVHLLQQDDLALTLRGQALDQLGRTVVAVVHEDDLKGDRWKCGLQPLDHVRHVLAFVLGRHHNRQERLRLDRLDGSTLQ